MTRQQAPRRYDFSWSRRNLAAGAAACMVFAAALAAGLQARPIQIGADIPLWGGRIAAAAERINPNTAAVGSLQRLPGIGRVRAEAIIAYRSEHGPGAFRRGSDLAAIRGIGPATVRGAERFMTFENAGAAEAPPQNHQRRQNQQRQGQ
jgi:competence ComEA-like helix-hairpin-helix protein